MARKMIEQANVRSWEKTCKEATDRQIVRWLHLRWSVWRRDVLVSIAHERGLL